MYVVGEGLYHAEELLCAAHGRLGGAGLVKVCVV